MYIFRKERDLGNRFAVSEVEFRIADTGLDELLEEFGYFLRGCSFVFDGEVRIVSDPEWGPTVGDDAPACEYVTLARVVAALRRVPRGLVDDCEDFSDDFVSALHAELNRDEGDTNAHV